MTAETTQAVVQGERVRPAPRPRTPHSRPGLHPTTQGHPTGLKIDTSHWRTRQDKIDKSGNVTLRHNSRRHHLGVGRRHAGTHVLILAKDHHVRVIARDTGELLRELVLNPAQDYQPQPKT